ncbi:dynein heavy chain 2, axonemal-like [Anarrhichthys ocellatus]|uniref:dynein heavy chain 2, axonemal-like n=1 Tax=Anarrhichthys ocellatus TaxID=433405 RepID=UPI0012ED2C6E|nr:dynein heavy chain 2, axonemal-like [Anarrhichthys ocellatus]
MRLLQISVDTLSRGFIVSTVDASDLLYPPKDGVFVMEVFTWTGLVGTRGTAVWWKLNPCRWSVPFPPCTSNLWKTARRQPGDLCLCHYFLERSGGAARPQNRSCDPRPLDHKRDCSSRQPGQQKA